MASSPLAANNGGSFSSTASSTSNSAHDHDQSDADKDAAVIKQEPTLGEATQPSDGYEPSVWAHIFDENGIITLDMEDDDPMGVVDLVNDPRRALQTTSGGGGAAFGAAAFGGGVPNSVMARDNSARGDAYFPHHTNVPYDPTPSSALLDNWGYYNDVDMTSPSHIHDDLTSRFEAARHTIEGPLPSTSLKMEPRTTEFDNAMGSTLHRTQPQLRTPSTAIAFEKQSNGKPFLLSKPILRDDGLLLVGTELSSGGANGQVSNRIFITDVRSFDPSRPTHLVPTQAEVRDLQWLGYSTALAAIGRDIHVIETETKDGAPTCRLLPPVRPLHADSIRELAVNPIASRHSITIASAGFDETVVLTTLGENGDPATAAITAKIDAFDVVSSVRWHPGEATRVSWTTDGGDFQVTDIRARPKPQLQVALNTLMIIEQMGGLFTHENISPSNVVLGFEMGQMLFLDLRMPRKECCYGAMSAPTAPIPVGEMRCSKDGAYAIFGVGGFATATVSATGQELENIFPVSAAHVQAGLRDYKTSGAFSAESNSLLAVSDSLGVVSIYNDNNKSRRTNFQAPRSAASSEGSWHERV